MSFTKWFGLYSKASSLSLRVSLLSLLENGNVFSYWLLEEELHEDSFIINSILSRKMKNAPDLQH